MKKRIVDLFIFLKKVDERKENASTKEAIDQYRLTIEKQLS